MNNYRSPISYRDPHGYVLEYESIYYRIVDKTYTEQYKHLIESGFYQELVSKKLITPFKEISDLPLVINSIYKILLPEQLEFISYPYEWCFEQWKDCLNIFLRINKIALKYGMILKDATPFNFTLQKGRFILFDILSFEFYKDGDPWIAYRQFCENFLAPISLMRYKSSFWSKLYSASSNGIDLLFTSKSLPFSSYFNLNCLLHIHIHSFFMSKLQNQRKVEKKVLKKDQLQQLLHSLTIVSKWELKKTKNSFWNNYYEQEIQNKDYLKHKEQIVEEWLKKIQPQTITDLGANTGKFSLLAAKYANRVVAIESDLGSLKSIYKLSNEQENIYPICADLSDPSPGLGWINLEKKSLLNRIASDATIALALIHHLRITNNIPIELIAKFLSSITNCHLILEYIPKSDEKIKFMLNHRYDNYYDYSMEIIEKTFNKYFDLTYKVSLNSSERILSLWSKK